MRSVPTTVMLSLVVLGLLVAAASADETLELKFEKYTLSNGMDVILHEDHSIPMVAVNIWYHVGSKNEAKGRTGFAHLFEHMMFQGSQHHDDDYFKPLQKIGGSVNGSTSEDRTNYWENVPSNYLELALWLESDRMGFLLPAMTQERLDNQRDVVKNERRERTDNSPYGHARELLLAMLFPDDHPYSWSVIGSMEDLSAASMEDVSDFFKQYYTPNNASLCIAGDFDPAQTKMLVEKYFGTLPAGPPVERLEAWIPDLDGEVRTVAEDDVELARLYYAWHSPAFYAPGDAEMDLLANVLTSGKTSRLYRALVYEQQIAQDVVSYQASSEVSSIFNIQVTVREGHTLEEAEAAVDAELSKLLAEGITQEELTQAQTAWEAQFVRALQQIGGFRGRAELLNRYNTLVGDPGALAWDMARYSDATVASVQKYLDEYIDLNERAVLHMVPQGSLAASTEEVDRTGQPEPAASPTFTPPDIQTGQLTNGVEILLVEDHRLPLVDMQLVIKSGWSADPVDRFGCASLTAALLDEGSKSRTALQIADEAKKLGAQLGTSSSYDGSSVSLNVLKKNLDPALDLMADVVLNPTFPEEELERQRQIYFGRIQQESVQPFAMAYKKYQEILFGNEHPYSQPSSGSGTEETITAIARADLEAYYKANYVPNNATVVITGDITLSEAQAKLEQAFGGWQQGTVTASTPRTPQGPTSTQIYLVDKPGAEQSMVMVGNLGMARNNSDYIAFQVMNASLGGQFTSRINMNLREDKGYTYGARSALPSRRGVAPFLCYAPVQAEFTKESLYEFVRELNDIVGERPQTDEELQDSKNSLIKRFPQRFQSYSAISGQLSDLVVYDLSLDDWKTYAGRIENVTSGAARNIAGNYVPNDALLIVVVGDREKIESGIRELNLGEIH